MLRYMQIFGKVVFILQRIDDDLSCFGIESPDKQPLEETGYSDKKTDMYPGRDGSMLFS